jgi:hypothetical protein
VISRSLKIQSLSHHDLLATLTVGRPTRDPSRVPKLTPTSSFRELEELLLSAVLGFHRVRNILVQRSCTFVLAHSPADLARRDLIYRKPPTKDARHTLPPPEVKDLHSTLWDSGPGEMLSAMTEMAGYPGESQAIHRAFFANSVASSLGPHPAGTGGGVSSWQSFMTDDHTPLELSRHVIRSLQHPRYS